MTEEPQVIVERFVTAIAEERPDDARALLHDELVVSEAGGLPYSGEYHCPDGFFELLGKMTEAMELTMGDSVQFLLADDTAAIRSRLKFTARASQECRDEFGRGIHGSRWSDRGA